MDVSTGADSGATDPLVAASPPRVAFQGEAGAFSEEAVREFFGDDAAPLPRREFRDLGAAVLSGEADYGMLPIENSLAGSVLAAHDVLLGSALEVVGEVVRPIRLCVLSVPGASLESLRRVLSHPVALAQCTRFLVSRGSLEAIAVYDTAGAAREVAERDDPTVGAIAARGAAARYGLEILAEGVQDRDDNQTRFLVVARPGAPLPDRRSAAGPTKTALEVETENRPGALVEILLPFARRGINLTKLESRPGGEPWTYRFFLEFQADAQGPGAREALEEIGSEARRLRVLGSFPSAAGQTG